MSDTSGNKVHAVTGAFGFSGQYIARRLLEQGKRVVNLTGTPERPDLFAGQVETRLFHFHDTAAMTEALRDVAVLYNTYWVRFNHADFSHVRAVRNSLVLFEAAKAAGVDRIVHISITNANPASPLEYFNAKGQLEKALKSFGVSHAVVRPALLFGPGDILINNTAWVLRRFPVFCLFGDGSYHVRPIHVDDLAAIMVEQGTHRENTLINALGPEGFTWRELVSMLADILGRQPRLIKLSPEIGFWAARVMGKLVGDVLVTREEISGLMAGLLDVPGAPSTGTIRLSDWARASQSTLGAKYHSELDRRNLRDQVPRHKT